MSVVPSFSATKPLSLIASSLALALALVLSASAQAETIRNVVCGPNDNFPALNFDAALAPTVSPVDFASAGDPPVLLVHGDADDLVNISHSENMYEALESAGIARDFVVIDGAGHGLFTDDDGVTAANALKGWFDQHL